MLLFKNPGNSKSVFTFLPTLLPMRFSPVSSALSPNELKNLTKMPDAKELQFLNLIHVEEPLVGQNAATWMLVKLRSSILHGSPIKLKYNLQ